MKNIKTKIIVLILCIISIKCAEFSKSGFRKNIDHLNKNNLPKLDAVYKIKPFKKIYHRNDTLNLDDKNDTIFYDNAYNFMLNNYDPKNKKFNDNECFIKLKIISKTELNLVLFTNSKILKDTIIKGKTKKGMFYLANKHIRCHGIPYILGGCYATKRRIGITKSGNLIINEAIDNTGAFLLIIGAGYSYNISYEYERIR